MFLAGGMSRPGINATAAGETMKASQYGAAAASFIFIFIFTFVFGATWLTVPLLYPAEIFSLEVRSQGNAWGVVGRRGRECWEWLAGMNIGPLILYLTNIRPRLCCALLRLTASGKRRSTSSP
jgi:uncharacterized protein (DUF1810 family)